MMFDNEQLIKFTKPISDHEDQKCRRAITVVINALKNSGYELNAGTLQEPSYTAKASYGNLKLTLFLQGSYANNTNVKLDSDIDVVVMLDSQFYPKYREGVSGQAYGFSTTEKVDIKSKVYEALCQYIGTNGVINRRNKCITLKENNCHVATDVVPCVEYRDYSNDFFLNPNNYVSGIKITTDDHNEIINYPKLHLENGRKKNEKTNHYYKKVVRIFKNLRNLMEENGQSFSADRIASFQLESLLWNIPDQYFLQYDEVYSLKIAKIMEVLLQEKINFSNYTEVNGIKPLFPTPDMLQTYQIFVDELYSFYQWR